MKKLQIGFLLIIFALIGNLQAQTEIFSQAKGSGVNQAYYEFDKWNFSIDKDRYEISKNGKGRRISEKNVVTNFRFALEKAEQFYRVVYFARYKNDLLLLSEISDGGYGSGFTVRLDGKTLKTKWQTDVDGFNVGQGLIENKFAYLTAIGFIAKLDLRTGKYIWKHNNLYRKYKESGAFNIFLTPQIKDGLVIFKEDDIEERGIDNQLLVNKTSGKIIEVLVK